MRDVHLPIEILNVLHRLILTRDNLLTQKLCAEVVEKILHSAKTAIEYVNKEGILLFKLVYNYLDVCNGNIDPDKAVYSGYTGNEDASGFDTHKSLSFATLEVALCLLVRQVEIYLHN